MADSGPSLESKGPTIAASANQCLESFQQCLFSASSVHPREVSMVEDQLARFSSWASSIGVFAPGSASMDHRLRYASEVQSVVTGLLESLNYRVQTCSKALAQLVEPSTTDVFTATNDRLGQSFLDIAAEITRLNKISNTIRRASKDTQVLKASNFQIKDDEGENTEPLLLSHFEHHIGDWFPGISETIRQRLARAMLLRRKRILYRRHRQGDSSIRSEKAISQTSVTLPNAQPGAGSSLQTMSKKKSEKAAINRPASKVAPSQVKSATTLAPEKFKMVSSSPSVVSASKTIASGKHQVLTYPPAPGFAAKRRYEKLKSQRIVEAAESTEHNLQELLESDLRAIGEIICPYCLYALPASEVFDERKWQNHVKNDLDPYVCLFEDCDQPDVLYTHSDEWLGHLHQHGKVWRCSSHREMGPFSTLEDYMKHMREVHDTKLNDRQLRVVANRNSRKSSKLFSSCPLCGRVESEVDGRLEDHLAGHLRSLALKSLPSYQDEVPDDVGDDNNSIDGSRPRSRSTIREMEEYDEEMPPDGAGNFWDQWNRQLSHNISVNFLGDVYFELDLGDSEARVASLFFDTMVFKQSSESLDDDPILQSMMQQQLARIEVIDAETDGILDISVGHEASTSSKATVGETSKDEEDGALLTQPPDDTEAAHAQVAMPGQDTEVDFSKEDEKSEPLIEPTATAPPVTKLDIPVDPDNANFSDVPIDKSLERDEVSEAAAQEPANVETVHAQTETVGKDVDVVFGEESESSKPQPMSQSLQDSESELRAFFKQPNMSEGALKFLKKGRELVQQAISAEALASLQRSDGVEGHDLNKEDTEDRSVVELSDVTRFLDKVKDHFRDKPEAYAEFLEILKTFKFEGTPVQDVDAQISALLESAPDLLEEFKQFRPKSAPSTKPDSQTEQDAGLKTRDIICGNTILYGHCRDKDQGCEFNHDYDTDSVSQTTQPPGAPLIGSMSPDEKDDPPDRGRKRESGIYVNAEKVMDLKRRELPLTKHQSSSSSLRKVPGGSSSSQLPPRPGVASEHQNPAASAPEAGLPRDGKAVPEHWEWDNSPWAPLATPNDGNYHPYHLPQSAPFKPPPTPSHPYPDDAFEADVEDDLPRPKNPRRKTRPGVQYNGQYFESSRLRELSRENSPVGSRRERIVIVDPPPSAPYYTAPNALGRRPVIVDERPRPRVEIEIVDGSQPRRRRYASDIPSSTRSLNEESTHPRHASEAPRSVRSLNDEYAEREKRRQRRRESKRQEEADERLRARINKANAEISGRPPVPVEPLSRSSYQRPTVQLPDETDLPTVIRWEDIEREGEARRRAANRKGQEKGPSVGDIDREAELAKVVLGLEAEQELYEEETRRLSQKEEGKGKENEGERKQPGVKFPNRQAELNEAVRQLNLERERQEEAARRRARREEREEDEIQRRRLMERMVPRDRSSAGTSSRRHRVLYDEGTYRWE
ncbi:C3H1-type domain-containing protein [Fusarium sp. LHS14.1]|nr:C3H1-type domain-containing protein [Fusarium sp. LHS14.1]